MNRSTQRVLRVFAVLCALGLLPLAAGCFGPIERPIADFTWCPDGSEGRLDYRFTSTSTAISGHRIERMVWEFDDGTPPLSLPSDPFHRFSEEGLYYVTLTVTDRRGVSGTVTKGVPIALAAFVHSTWSLTLGYPPTVAGIVENRYSERLTSVVMRAKFYDADGIRLTDGRFEITDLDPGELAAFEVNAREFTTRIFHATVDIESFHADCGPWIPPAE